MLELYYGTDTTAVRSAAMAAVARLVSTGARLERLESEVWQVGKLAEVIGSTSLFGDQTVYVIDTPSEDEAFYELLVRALPDIAASSNSIVVIERGLLAAEKKHWLPHALRAEESLAGPASGRFDPFSMAEALVTKDKKTLWLLLAKAKQAGLSAEEIIGTLWWQLKTMRLAARTNSADEAGVKSYPYDKAKRALRHYKPGEVEALSRQLLLVYHEGHGGVRDIDTGLEEWVLRI